MLLYIIIYFFGWLVYRELTSMKVSQLGLSAVSIPYLSVVGVLFVLVAWKPYSYWSLERNLSRVATELADGKPASVHCNSPIDAIFDSNVRVAGHANLRTGEIVFQYKQCGYLMGYLDHPERASRRELWSLNLLTHESMHIRGERDETSTECQAVQRNYRAAKLLGVVDSIAKQSAAHYYKKLYPTQRGVYYSDQCAPGKSMDEKLIDSTWLYI